MVTIVGDETTSFRFFTITQNSGKFLIHSRALRSFTSKTGKIRRASNNLYHSFDWAAKRTKEGQAESKGQCPAGVNCSATRGRWETDLVILNHGQVTRTTPELAPHHTNGSAPREISSTLILPL
ncbi:hypothetical protein TNCV_3926811 [Trichonephila clavipes]|nr:hypothetical protein TNCV_3926811 [Trichonephila clavipes]